MCPCGGELTVWCYDCGDWVCDDCGCREDHGPDNDPDYYYYPDWPSRAVTR